MTFGCNESVHIRIPYYVCFHFPHPHAAAADVGKSEKKKLGTAIVGSREYEHTHESNPSSPWTDVGMKKETIL
jgi:hypothetical protein